MRVLGFYIASFAVAVAFVLGPRPVAAQDCGFYQEFGCAEEVEHWVYSGPLGVIENPHVMCLICIYGPCHPNCEPEEDEEVKLAYAAATDAAAEGDVVTLIELLPGLRGHLTYNRDRNAIQLRSCDREFVIASINVPESLVEVALQLLL